MLLKHACFSYVHVAGLFFLINHAHDTNIVIICDVDQTLTNIMIHTGCDLLSILIQEFMQTIKTLKINNQQQRF